MMEPTPPRDLLMSLGFFPETVPPCFSSKGYRDAFEGIYEELNTKKFHKGRETRPILYSGTKHDGNRRPYATPHIVSYMYICDFIGRHWGEIHQQCSKSAFSLSIPVMQKTVGDRAISVTPLPQVSSAVSRNISHAPILLKADISQFYPSIYTHTIAWAAHGRDKCKADKSHDSASCYFNELDFFIMNAQDSQSRGLLIGPDAYRIIAEFIASKIDGRVSEKAGDLIVGAARHVDDFYIGVRSEADAALVLSHLRSSLEEYSLGLNDLKTKILPTSLPLDDPWAARLRESSKNFDEGTNEEVFVAFLNDAMVVASQSGSQSPVKLAVRRLDKAKLYKSDVFVGLESYLQRLSIHFPHAIDYICLVVAKRIAIGEAVDRKGWEAVIKSNLLRHARLGHDHEACWMFWLAVVAGIKIDKSTIDEIDLGRNKHLLAMLVKAFVDNKLDAKPKFEFAKNSSSTESTWLAHMVAREGEVTKKKFSGHLAGEVEHLVSSGIELVNFDTYLKDNSDSEKRAISNSRFGYEDDDEFEGADSASGAQFSEPDDDEIPM